MATASEWTDWVVTSTDPEPSTLPSEWTDWAVTATGAEPGEGIPSEWTDWAITSTSAEPGASSPSQWTDWVITRTDGPQEPWLFVAGPDDDWLPAEMHPATEFEE